LLSYHASAVLNASQAPGRLGNAHPSICPYETFPAKDGYVNIACGNDGQFEKLCSALEKSELVGDERFSTNAARVKNRDALIAIFNPILESRSVDDWIEKIKAVGVPCGPILPVPESLAHPQVEARGTIIEDDHARAGKVRNIGSPLGFAKKSYAQYPAPLCGEHSEAVLADVLGFSSDEIEAFKSAGVFS